VSIQILPHDVVGAPCGPKLRACPPVLWRAGGKKNSDAETTFGVLILQEREEIAEFSFFPNILDR